MNNSLYMQKLKGIIEHYGIDNQLDMLIEECAELIQAIRKIKRANTIEERVKANENFYEELCDVNILLDQVFLYLGNIDYINEIIKSKIDRQYVRMLKGE